MDVDDQVCYVVDYDVPAEPQAKRRSFYRKLAKLKKERGFSGEMSTKSVLFTCDRELAEQVFSLASRFGKGNIRQCQALSHIDDKP